MTAQVNLRVSQIQTSKHFTDSLNEQPLRDQGEGSVCFFRLKETHSFEDKLSANYGFWRLQNGVVEKRFVVINPFGGWYFRGEEGGTPAFRPNRFLDSNMSQCKSQEDALKKIGGDPNFLNGTIEQGYEVITNLFLKQGKWPPPHRIVPLILDDDRESCYFVIIKGVKRYNDWDDYPQRGIVREDVLKVDSSGIVTVHEYAKVTEKVFDQPSRFYSPKDFVAALTACDVDDSQFIGMKFK